MGNKKEELDGLVLSHDFDGRFLDKTQAKATGELLAKVLREHIAIVTIKPGVSIPGEFLPDIETFTPPELR